MSAYDSLQFLIGHLDGLGDQEHRRALKADADHYPHQANEHDARAAAYHDAARRVEIQRRKAGPALVRHQ